MNISSFLVVYRHTEAVEARLNDNRERILRAARTLVSEGGWREAQVAHVAAAAGIATGTVYRYFPSKIDLFIEVLGEVSEREIEVARAVLAADASPLERLQSAVAIFIRRAMQKPRLAYAMLIEPCEGEIDERRRHYRFVLSEALREVIEDGQASGDLRADVDAAMAASVVVGGFTEALIGPLSPLTPLSALQHAEAGDVREHRERLARQAARIAAVACACIVPAAPRAAVHRLPGRAA